MILPDDYRLIQSGAVLATVAPRGVVAVSGRDRGSYLHGLLTNDTASLAPGTGCYAAWLTPNGRMTVDMHVFESGDLILLDVPAASVADLVARLEQFVFTEDVQVADLGADLDRLEVHGPEAGAVIARALGEPSELLGIGAWPQYRNVRVPRGDAGVVVARVDRLGVPGFVLYVARGERADCEARLTEAGARSVSAEAVEAARIEAGWPVYGVDMDETIIPLEAGIESRAISMTKGCYVGQEIIVRVLHRGQGRGAKKLVGLRVDGDAPLDRGEKLDGETHEAGWVTSSAVSPVHGVVALAYVQRASAPPGVRLRTASGRQVEVSALPIR